MNLRYLPTGLALACACLSAVPVGARPVNLLDGGPARMAAAPVLAVDPGTDRLIVKYRSGSAATARGQAAQQVAGNRHGVRMSHLRHTSGGAQVLQLSRRLADGDVATLAASLRAGDPDIEFAEPDRLLQPLAMPNDPMLSQQWALQDATAGIRAPAAWDRSKGAGITVAVIDTGVRRHADLVANLLPGYDFIVDTRLSADGNGRDADALDPGDAVAAGYCGSGTAASNSSWHGTHVAGIIAATGGNAKGVVGVAYAAKVLPLRVLGRCGGYTSDIADAIVWAVGGSVAGLPVNANPARVINLSLGGRGACGLTAQNAINSARAKGAVVVVAAGNENADAATSAPANCSGVVVVAATGKTGAKASYSNTGASVTLAAPGGDVGAGIVSTLNAGISTPGADNYASYMGTSMATPAVAGVAALMLAVNQKLTPDQVAALLKSSARAFPASCAKCGAGLLDANAAVVAAAAATGGTSTPTPTPVATPVPAPTPAPVVTAVVEMEPNDTLAKAQAISVLPANLGGSIASTGDLDHYRLALAGGKKLTVKLVPTLATSGFGLAVLNSAGQSLLVLPASAGQTSQVTITNGGAGAVTLLLKVSRSTGATGAYKLTMTY